MYQYCVFFIRHDIVLVGTNTILHFKIWTRGYSGSTRHNIHTIYTLHLTVQLNGYFILVSFANVNILIGSTLIKRDSAFLG